MAKYRTPGQWKSIAAQRAHKTRVNRTGRGLTNIPDITETGSAAYRRFTPRRRDRRTP